MTFEEKLAMYRQSFGLERQDAEQVKKEVPEPTGFESLNWGADVDAGMSMGPDWGSEEKDAFVMRMGDDRIFNDEETDRRNYEELLATDPAVMEYGPQMEELLKELEGQMLDPNNPMTQQEAEKTFIELMEQNFGAKFKGA